MNNVGTNIRSFTAEYSDEDYRHIMSTNLDSAFLLTKVSDAPTLAPVLKVHMHTFVGYYGLTEGQTADKSPFDIVWMEKDFLLQASYDMLKASGNAAVIMMSSIAGGPTTVNSGAPYAMTKGEPPSIRILGVLMLASCIQQSS